MKKLYTLFSLLLCFQLSAQDTLTVQTLEFSDITKRRGWYVFPPDTGGVRKVTMKYTLKCDPQTTQDNFNCGEWDYTTLCNLFEYKGIGTPFFTMNGNSSDTIFYNNGPAYNYYQSYDYFPVYTTTVSENLYPVGAGSSPMSEVFQTNFRNNRAQFMFTAAELASAGVQPGDIHKISMDIAGLGDMMENFTLKMKHSALTELTPASYESGGFQTVLNGNIPSMAASSITLNFAYPFNWDGVSNLVLEFSYTNNNYNPSTSDQITSHTPSFNAGVHTFGENSYMEFNRPEYIEVPATAFAQLDSFITVSFWAWGDENVMPINSYTFEGRDGNGNRVINAHLPWSNSRIYWDAGNSGGGSYDRIDQAANFSDFAGQWNHYAFVKDVAAGTMEIYINGNLWHSGTGKTRTMEGITTFLIGGRAGQDGEYEGKMDEFRIWDAALTQTEIQNYMYQSVDAGHPQYSNLLAAYSFDDLNGQLTSDYSGNGNDATLMGIPAHKLHEGGDMNFDIQQAALRPNVTFIQGVYVMELDSVLILDSLAVGTNTLVEQNTARNFTGQGISYTNIDTSLVYPGNFYSYTYDENGNVIDSTWISYDAYELNFLEIITHQIQNYVTPYGIGLDLGPDGFRWEYEVTDYLPILSDTVEIRAGNQQELIDLKFEFIEGTPARDVVDFQTIWTGNYQHSDIANDNVMPAVDVDINPNATQFSLKTRATGHWFGGFENCAEFCPKNHHIDVNGNQEFQWTVWKECSDNPVVDQGGTWIYDRAGWCPGTFANTYDYDITDLVNPGSTASIDYGMQTTAGGMEGNYWVALQMVSYGDINFQTDAEVMYVVAPNDWEFFNRLNPICSQPIVQIRNLGSDTLTSLKIAYKLRGGVEVVYDWTGSLAFMEEEVVELDAQGNWWWNQHDGSQMFEVELREPNGVADENPDNDVMAVHFETPDVLPNYFYFWIQTNAAAHENVYRLKDWEGNIIFERDNWANNTTYRDTFDLDEGCYQLEIIDSDEDGLSFFANNDGNGTFRWRPVGSGSINTFEPNFGDKLIYNFTVGGPWSIEDNLKESYLRIAPNPSTGMVNLVGEGFNGGTQIEVYDLSGKIVYSESLYQLNGGFNKSIDLSFLNKGMYMVNITDGEHRAIEQLIIE